MTPNVSFFTVNGIPQSMKRYYIFRVIPNYAVLSNLMGQKFLIPGNLDIGLRYLRFKDKPRLLWDDAICINQISDEGRSQQVQQMRSIYEHASSVTVWLESAPEGIDRTFA